MSWYDPNLWNYRLWKALKILNKKVAEDYFWGKIDAEEAIRYVGGTNLGNPTDEQPSRKPVRVMGDPQR